MFKGIKSIKVEKEQERKKIVIVIIIFTIHQSVIKYKAKSQKEETQEK